MFRIIFNTFSMYSRIKIHRHLYSISIKNNQWNLYAQSSNSYIFKFKFRSKLIQWNHQNLNSRTIISQLHTRPNPIQNSSMIFIWDYRSKGYNHDPSHQDQPTQYRTHRKSHPKGAGRGKVHRYLHLGSIEPFAHRSTPASMNCWIQMCARGKRERWPTCNVLM